MRRLCNGKNDKNRMWLDPKSGERLTKPPERPWDACLVPCDCGLWIDDEKRNALYPHEDIQ